MSERYDHAACLLENPELFYPDGRGASNSRRYRMQVAEAKAVCRGCPLVDTCLDEHLFDEYGIVGGTTEEERHEVRRRRGVTMADRPGFRSSTPEAIRRRERDRKRRLVSA